MVSSDAGVRKVLQEIVDGRLRLLPVSEHTGHLCVHFKAGRVRTVEWRTLDGPDEVGKRRGAHQEARAQARHLNPPLDPPHPEGPEGMILSASRP